MRRFTTVLLLVVSLASACSRKMEGPSPVISNTVNEVDVSRSPAVVCNAQGDRSAGWLVDIFGDNFSPIPQDVLGDTPGTILPAVSLSGPQTYSFAPDRVFFSDKTKLVLQMPTSNTTSPLQLPIGSYRLTVTNPDGSSGSLDGAITIVAPPTIATVTVLIPPLPTSDGTIALDGANFQPGTTPVVTISGSGLPTVQLVNVTVVNSTRVTAVVPANTAEGVYDVTIKNADGCSFTLPRAFTISYHTLGLLALDPRFGWQLKNQGITIYNSPTGSQQPFSGGAPQGWIVAPLKTNPTIAVEIPLRRIAYVSAQVITAAVPDCSGMAALPITDATCPNGIQPGGPYPIKIRDPNGAVGVIPATRGFWVLADPPPVITSIAPAAIDTNGLPSSLGNALVVTGQNFGSAAQLQLVFPNGSGGIRVCNLAVTTSSATSIQAPVPTSLPSSSCVEFDSQGNQTAATAGFTLSAGLYVVRVQNTTNPAYADYSGLTVTNPSLNPRNGDPLSSELSVARADFPLVEASDDLGNQYLYAIGGTDGVNTLSSVEVAPLTLFGDLGGDCASTPCKFRQLDRTQIGMGNMGTSPEPRRGIAAFVRTIPGDTSYVYLVGGVNASGTALRVVERAQVLKAADAPSLLPPNPAPGGNLAAGTFYYRVSAIQSASNLLNPSGETLASDEQPINVDAGGQALLSWTCIPGVQKYRVYRTASPNGISGTEQLLAEVAPAVACTGSPLPAETYYDTGALTPGGDKPLPAGGLGRWASQPELTVERGNGAAKLLGDQLYVAGGFCSTVAIGCSAPDTDLASVETAAFASGSPALGAFSTASTLQKARRRFALTVADAASAPSSFSSTAPDNTHDAWLVAVGGDSAGVVITSPVIEVAQVKNSSGVIASPTFAAASYIAPATHGGWSEIAGNFLFEAGTTSTDTFDFHSNIACPTSGGQVAECTGAASFRGTLNATGIAYQSGGDRYLGGETLFRAFVYVAGGLPTAVSTTPTATIERIIY
jgi:hypothetical protein